MCILPFKIKKAAPELTEVAKGVIFIMFYENLLQICKLKNVSVTNLIAELGLSSGNLSSWKKGNKPRSDTLVKIAERLDVSVNYLLGESENNEATKLYARYSQLNPEQQALVENLMRQLENSRPNQ